MQHLDEGTIHAWLDGALPADEAAGVERHARECADCAALVAYARGVIAGVARIVSALDDVPAGVVPKAQPMSESRSLWRTLRVTPFRAAIAASLMVFAASLAVIRHAPHDAPTASQVAPAASAPPAVDANAASPSAQEKTVNTGEKKLNRASITVPSVAAPPPPTAETKSAVPKAAELRRDSGPRDAVRGGRDVVASASIADSIGPPAARPLAEAARREAANATVSAPAAASAAIVFEATRKSVATQLRATTAGPITQPFRMMLTSADNRPLVFPGCYQLVHDTTSLAPLPERFSLESDGDANARRNIVRALTADGRPDSVVTGVRWEVTTTFSAGIVIARDGPVAASAFSKRAATPSVRGEMARSVAIIGQLSRIECR